MHKSVAEFSLINWRSLEALRVPILELAYKLSFGLVDWLLD